MNGHTKGMVSSGLPWSRDARWEVVAFEAMVLIGIGGFMLVATDTARDVTLQLIGVVLLGASLLLGVGTFRDTEARLGVFDAFRAGVGVSIGLIATASWWSDYIDTPAVRVILGWGLIAYSVLHLVGLIAVRGRSGLRPSIIAIVAMTLVLGIMLLTSDDTTSSGRITLLGSIFLAFGVLLAALAYFLRSRGQPSAAPHPA